MQSIESLSIPGCTYLNACNYDSTANQDDSSCVYIDNPVVDLTQGNWVCGSESNNRTLERVVLKKQINQCKSHTAGWKILFLFHFSDGGPELLN